MQTQPCQLALLLTLTLSFAAGCGQSSQTPPVAKDGLPRTLQELNAWYVDPPAGENAATLFVRGFDALQVDTGAGPSLMSLNHDQWPAPGKPVPATMKSALTGLVQRNAEALQLFEQAASFEKSRYSVDLTRGMDAVFPHLSKVRNAARVIAAAALLHGEGTDGKQAAQDILTALGLARSLAEEPAFMSQLIRASSLASALTALEQTLNRTALPPASLKELFAAFKQSEESDTRGDFFNRAVVGERLTVQSVLASPQKLLEQLPPPGPDLPPEERAQIEARLQQGKKLKPEQQFFDDSMRKLMAFRKLPLPDRLKAGDLMRQLAVKATDAKLPVAAYLVRGLAPQATKEASAVAALRLGLTAVALEQFRTCRGQRYPDSLAQLSPEFLSSIPEDPFNGEPLRYRPQAGGYQLYSIGPDLKDDGGRRQNHDGGDIVFEVVASAPRAR